MNFLALNDDSLILVVARLPLHDQFRLQRVCSRLQFISRLACRYRKRLHLEVKGRPRSPVKGGFRLLEKSDYRYEQSRLKVAYEDCFSTVPEYGPKCYWLLVSQQSKGLAIKV